MFKRLHELLRRRAETRARLRLSDRMTQAEMEDIAERFLAESDKPLDFTRGINTKRSR